MYPFESDASIQEYPPFGAFEIHSLRWKHVPKEASGEYHCYDAKTSKIPPSKVFVNVTGVNLFYY